MDIYNCLKELTKFEIVFKDKNNFSQNLRSHIKSLDGDKVLISPPMVKGKAVDIPDGQEIKLFFHTEEGVFSGESTVISKELSQTAGLWINYPYNSQRCQRREYVRVDLNLDFDLVLQKDDSNNNTSILKLKSRNISGKGISFVTEEPIGDYYNIQAKIYLRDDKNDPVIVNCEHIYTHEQGATKKQYLNALAFIDLDEKDMERIIKKCFKHQLEQRKKERL